MVWCALYLANNSLSTKLIYSDYILWMVNRFSKKLTHECVPGFTAVRSATVNAKEMLE